MNTYLTDLCWKCGSNDTEEAYSNETTVWSNCLDCKQMYTRRKQEPRGAIVKDGMVHYVWGWSGTIG